MDELLHKQGYFPKSDMRVTCWLPDVLLNNSSATGPTYFDGASKIKVENRYYTIQRAYRTGINRPTVIIINLNEIENYV